MLKRAAEDPYAPPVPLKRRSVEIDPALRAEWRRSAEHQQQAISSSPPSSQQQQTSAAAVDAISGLTADDWCVLFFSSAHAIGARREHCSAVLKSATTTSKNEPEANVLRICFFKHLFSSLDV
jgi:hypothetical protein